MCVCLHPEHRNLASTEKRIRTEANRRDEFGRMRMRTNRTHIYQLCPTDVVVVAFVQLHLTLVSGPAPAAADSRRWWWWLCRYRSHSKWYIGVLDYVWMCWQSQGPINGMATWAAHRIDRDQMTATKTDSETSLMMNTSEIASAWHNMCHLVWSYSGFSREIKTNENENDFVFVALDSIGFASFWRMTN